MNHFSVVSFTHGGDPRSAAHVCSPRCRMNSAASSPSKKPLAPLVAVLAIEAVSIDSASRRRNSKGPLRKSKMQQTDFRQPDRILFFFRARENVTRCIAAAPKKSGIGAVLSEFAGFGHADRPK